MSVTKKQILAALVQLNGCAIGSFDLETIVKLKGGKKNPMLGNVVKKAYGANVMFFSDKNKSGYETMVKKRLAQEGKDPDTFKVGELPWGERIPETPIIMHKGELYLRAIYLHEPQKIEYFYNGKPIEKKDIIGLDDDKGEAKQGGLSNKVVIRTPLLSSIKRIKCGKLSVESLPV